MKSDQSNQTKPSSKDSEIEEVLFAIEERRKRMSDHWDDL